MRTVEFSQSRGVIADPNESIPSASTVKTIEYRGRHLPDKVRRIKRSNEHTIGDFVNASAHPDRLIGIKIGEVEPITVFVDGSIDEAHGKVTVALPDHRQVTRRSHRGDRVVFATIDNRRFRNAFSKLG